MKKTYEVIEETSVVNMSNEPIKSLKKGDKIVGEMVQVDGNPYVEIVEDQEYVDAKGLAESLSPEVKTTSLEKTAATVKASHKKLIYALVGAAAGFGIGYVMKVDTKKKIIFTISGVGLGLLVEYINGRKK